MNFENINPMLHKQLLISFQRLITYCNQNQIQIKSTEKSLKESFDCILRLQDQLLSNLRDLMEVDIEWKSEILLGGYSLCFKNSVNPAKVIIGLTVEGNIVIQIININGKIVISFF